MSRYIDADALIKRIEFCSGKGMGAERAYMFMRMVDDAPTIKTKEIKYFDEDEKIWKIGRVIVDEVLGL